MLVPGIVVGRGAMQAKEDCRDVQGGRRRLMCKSEAACRPRDHRLAYGRNCKEAKSAEVARISDDVTDEATEGGGAKERAKKRRTQEGKERQDGHAEWSVRR